MKKKEPQPLWTTSSKPVNLTEKLDKDGNGTGVWVVVDKNKPAYWEHRLHYERRKVHSVKGATAKDALDAIAAEYNRTGYKPIFSSTKLLHELSASVRAKLAEYSPELPFGTEVTV